MLYGIILDGARDGVVHTYGLSIWKRIAHELELSSERFDLFTHYSDSLMLNICDCLVYILHEGTRDTYLKFFGQDFFRYFENFGYEKLLRVSGRTLREFFFVIDQLHDSTRFTFPQMQQPSFHVTEEDHTGVTLEYKSMRHGFIHYAMGTLLGAAKRLFSEINMKLYVRSDLSTETYTHVIFWVQFDNKTHQKSSLANFPDLPDLSATTFFKVFPFSILMDSSLRIRHLGNNIRKLFPTDISLTGRALDEVFRLIRPNIHVEWDKILSHGKHMLFLMENRIPLRGRPSGKIRLKGQMKYIESKNMLWFLCHPVLDSADDMISAGLHLTDLNLFDSTSELLITSMHQTKEIEDIIEKQKLCITQLEQTNTKLSQQRRHNRNLLYANMPKHIALMIQSGVQACSLCESYPLITVMFAHIMDCKTSINHLQPTEIIESVNDAISIFDSICEKFDVFKIKTKLDGNYMIVAGLHDRSNSLTAVADDDREIDKNPFGLSPTEIIACLSFELLRATEHLINPVTHKPFGIKIGFHAGAAVGGIVGDQNLQYCLFGDTVSTARQIMHTGETGRIHISQTAYHHLLKDNRFTLEYRGQTHIKGRNMSATYWLTGPNKSSSTTTTINKSKRYSQCPFSGKLF